MIKIKHICAAITAAIAVMAAPGCDDAPDGIYADVEMLLEAPGGERLVLVRPDNGRPSTFLRDINNRREYSIPLFSDNRAEVRLERGVYIMAFDGEAVMADGNVRRVRMTGHSVMRDAIILNKARETVTFKIMFL